MKTLAKIVVAGLALVGAGAVVAAAWFISGGISARPEPGRAEEMVARRLRLLAIPRGAYGRKNPVEPSREALREAMAHFADHCAVCHANDGSGETAMGRDLYPRPPDMRKEATQALSDGALFYIIENGVRLTGMPAWATGTPEGEQSTWRLVRFVRHLPDLSDDELADMSDMNPKSADEWRQEEAARRFLEGGTPAATPVVPTRHEDHGGRR